MTDVGEVLLATEENTAPSKLSLGRSFLMADVGSSTTTVTLYDLVDGRYRLIGRGASQTTIGPPWYDQARGLQQAIQQISDSTGRTLLNEQGNLLRPRRQNGNGVDEFGAVVSAGAPLRVLVAGLQEDVSVASARHVLESGYTEEVDCFCLSDKRSRPGQIKALLKKMPDVILLVGGTDGGADTQLAHLLDTLAMGISLFEDADRPVVIYAGNAEFRAKVKEELGELTEVYLSENVRPEMEKEQLDHAVGLLTEMYLSTNVSQVPGIDGLQEWSSFPLRTTAHTFVGIGEYFSALHNARVICLDVGSNQVTFASIEPGKVNLVVRADMGMGRPVTRLIRDGDLSAIASWADTELDLNAIRNFIHNKANHPNTVPLTEGELRLEVGILGQLVSQTIQRAAKNWEWSRGGMVPSFRVLLLRGGSLANTPRPKMTLLALLEAMQPTGVFEVLADPNGVLPAMGLLAPEEPEMVVQLLNSGMLERWGCVIAPFGRARPGEKIIEVGIRSDGVDSFKMEVAYGSLEIFPLPANKPSVVTMQPSSGFDIGYGRGKGGKVTVRGTSVGLVIDARGRPLQMPDDVDARRELIQQWLQDIGA